MRPPSSRSLAAVAVTLALGEVAVAAPSAPRTPYDAPPPATATAPVVALAPPPSEAGLVMGEVALGFVAATTMTAGGLVLIANNQFNRGGLELGVVFGLLSPLVTAGVVCRVGSTSRAYHGRCGVAVGDAYAGMLLAIPTGYLGLAASRTGLGLAAGAFIGYVLGTTTGAVVGWNTSRVPFAPARPSVAPPPRDDSSETAARSRGLFEPIGRPPLTLPVLAFQF